jgi:CRP-like cAMP-binding protein
MPVTATDAPKAPEPALRVAVAETADEREACFRLRYRVYVEEMGKRPAAADHVRKSYSDALDEPATLLYVSDGSEVVASVRTLWGGDATPAEYVERYDLDGVLAPVPKTELGFTSYLNIAPEWRQTRAMGMALEGAYRRIRERGAWLSFVQGNPALIPMYERMGFRRFRPNITDPDFGLRLPLALVADDVQHLSRVHSPFARFAADYSNDARHAEWFARTFSAYAQPSIARLMGTDEFLRYVAERMFTDENLLFKGVDKDEVAKIVQSGVILRARAGEPIVRTGDAGTEMFTVLSGAAEVRKRTKSGQTVVLQTLGKGHIFGEMALLSPHKRTADVVALSDVELLMLSKDFFEKLMTSAPIAAGRMLWNLAVTLCDRLHLTTDTLVADAPAA